MSPLIPLPLCSLTSSLKKNVSGMRIKMCRDTSFPGGFPPSSHSFSLARSPCVQELESKQVWPTKQVKQVQGRQLVDVNSAERDARRGAPRDYRYKIVDTPPTPPYLPHTALQHTLRRAALQWSLKSVTTWVAMAPQCHDLHPPRPCATARRVAHCVHSTRTRTLSVGVCV